jgi:AcrR family transcriptional regulator
MTSQGTVAGEKAPAKRRTAREKLLEAASRKFYSAGLTATGIDTVTTAAGVAKKSLYNNFSSKSDLIMTYLDARHREWMEFYARRVAEADEPAERVLAVFDAYLDHALAGYEFGFRGCGLLNAAAELPVGDPGRDVVRRHKEEVESIIAGHLADMDPAPPLLEESGAEHLAFLLEGAMARAGLEGADRCLRDARKLAQTLLTAT